MAQTLPVLPVPEQFKITLVRFDMVDFRCKSMPSLPCTLGAIRVTGQKQLAFLSPPMTVQSCGRGITFRVQVCFMFIAIALGGQRHTAAMPAGSWYLGCHIRSFLNKLLGFAPFYFSYFIQLIKRADKILRLSRQLF